MLGSAFGDKQTSLMSSAMSASTGLDFSEREFLTMLRDE